MLKKLSRILVFIIVISLFFSTTAYGAGKADIYDPDTPATEQTILKITRPEGKETTYNKSYEICGYTDKENVNVEFLILEGSKYVKLNDTKGYSSWSNIGVLFAKEVNLNDGNNYIRIVAYTKANPDELQVSDFTIKVVDKSVMDKLKDGFYDTLNKLFSKR